MKCLPDVSVVFRGITDKWKQFSLLVMRHNKKMRFNSAHEAFGQKLVTGLTQTGRGGDVFTSYVKVKSILVLVEENTLEKGV